MEIANKFTFYSKIWLHIRHFTERAHNGRLERNVEISTFD